MTTFDPGARVFTHGLVLSPFFTALRANNPSVMLAAGLLARNAVKKGLKTKPWVKTSLAPGSKVVTDYLEQAGVQEYLDQLGLPARRLRLHDVHRQLGPAARADRRRRSRAASS